MKLAFLPLHKPFPVYCIIEQDMSVAPPRSDFRSPRLPRCWLEPALLKSHQHPSANWQPPKLKLWPLSLTVAKKRALKLWLKHYLHLAQHWWSSRLPSAWKSRAPFHRGGRRLTAKPNNQQPSGTCRCSSHLSSLDISQIAVLFCWTFFTYASLNTTATHLSFSKQLNHNFPIEEKN